ncbi:DUF433 domain-containing protein [Mesorhizobium sp. M4B.F.Ca.ET.049.02.1.2]|uniref:DUF433 domain-containing protein n=1 Tax=Mesorhizobium sp. M4B.F.Ca.ET.049.02.1.2 TaxID=2496752 RepID=UPI000FCCC9B6|nr:DUF433 domain-containing protein [Mesorhizobium sp. M4B.F.Ca.ET.049.02.1.2]RUW72011.1 DUF433 domain-containing protein [Mesorhizobium sp. M4B.F.Ca.ET.049.02.1.2]
MVGSDANVVLAAFTEDQTERLTGISKRQLRYWDRIDFFAPSFAYKDRRKAHSRLYSFRDIVSLKVLDALRNGSNVPLSHLREVKAKLAHLGDDMWAKTTLHVLNRRVGFINPETKMPEDILSGQGILQIALQVVTGGMETAVRAMWQRQNSTVGKLEQKRGVVHNQVVIAGTRIPVRSVKAFAEAGYSIDQILAEYPTLTKEDVRAAINYDAAA